MNVILLGKRGEGGEENSLPGHRLHTLHMPPLDHSVPMLEFNGQSSLASSVLVRSLRAVLHPVT